MRIFKASHMLAVALLLLVGCGKTVAGLASQGQLTGIRAAARAESPKFWILKSKGVCDGCAEAISKMLFTANVPSQILGPEDLQAHVGPQDVVVIGGSEPDDAGEYTVKQDLMRAHSFQWLKDHIYNGGRYIGICSGAYLTEEWIDQKAGIHGLNIFPGKVDNYTMGKDARYVKTHWTTQGVDRYAYFQDGPAFYPTPGANLKVMGTFDKDGTVASAIFPYGKGKVGVISTHLEADKAWGTIDHIHDPDGLDYDLGIAIFRQVQE